MTVCAIDLNGDAIMGTRRGVAISLNGQGMAARHLKVKVRGAAEPLNYKYLPLELAQVTGVGLRLAYPLLTRPL